MADSGIRISVIMPMDRPGDDAFRAVASVLSQRPGFPFELIVVARTDPGLPPDRRLRVIAMEERNPAIRRNAGAREARGEILGFIDDDAFAEPDWLARAAGWLDEHPGVVALGGPDPSPRDASIGELISDTLLATPRIGSGIAAHESRKGIFAVRHPWDLALVNLFVRKSAFDRLGGFDESIGYIGEDTDLLAKLGREGIVLYHEGVVVRHRRRRFPRAYLAQRWRYRVKTGQRLVRSAIYRRPAVIAFLAAGLGFLALAAVFPPAAVGALLVYALLVTALAIPATRLPAHWWPVIPVAFLLHHATYFAGIVAGMLRGLFRRA